MSNLERELIADYRRHLEAEATQTPDPMRGVSVAKGLAVDNGAVREFILAFDEHRRAYVEFQLWDGASPDTVLAGTELRDWRIACDRLAAARARFTLTTVDAVVVQEATHG